MVALAIRSFSSTLGTKPQFGTNETFGAQLEKPHWTDETFGAAPK